jgi:2-oxo-4-hydroxy-4-carboxy-5-ureidoimidazoline decarboxylase
MSDPIEWLNALAPPDALAGFRRCCASTRWAANMTAARPFASRASLAEAAERLWWQLDEADWLEAFRAHPRIGERATGNPTNPGAGTIEQQWARREQAGTQAASADCLTRLAAANQAYERRFGYIFIVCATGRSAGEMLEALAARLNNEPRDEIRIAAAEQARITALRLGKWLDTLSGGTGTVVPAERRGHS